MADKPSKIILGAWFMYILPILGFPNPGFLILGLPIQGLLIPGFPVWGFPIPNISKEIAPCDNSDESNI